MADHKLTRPIRAHEIGEYAYCSRAWWLVHVQGVVVVDEPAEMRVGTASHRLHTRVLTASLVAWRAGLALSLLAAALAVAGWLRS